VYHRFREEGVEGGGTGLFSISRTWCRQFLSKLDSGTIYNLAEGFWIRPSFKHQFLSRAVPNLSITIRNFCIVV
jgi:hypothetical protein